jgi:hypothetical protein
MSWAEPEASSAPEQAYICQACGYTERAIAGQPPTLPRRADCRGRCSFLMHQLPAGQATYPPDPAPDPPPEEDQPDGDPPLAEDEC